MIGLVSKLEPNIVIESSLLKGLIENATNDGFGLKQLFIRICSELLEFGRCGLLVDVDGAGVCHISLYMMRYQSLTGRKTALVAVRI